MDDPSLIRVHRFQIDGLSGLLDFHGNVLRQILKRCLPSFSVVLGIQLDPDIVWLSLIDNQRSQVLQRIQCLSSLPDQKSHLVSFHRDVQALSVIGRAQIHCHPHRGEHILQKCLSPFNGFTWVVQHLDVTVSSLTSGLVAFLVLRHGYCFGCRRSPSALVLAKAVRLRCHTRHLSFIFSAGSPRNLL